MANKKVIVVVGSSEQSREEAVRNVVRKATDSVRRIESIDVLHQSACGDEAGEIIEFRATVQVSFELE